MAKKRKSKKAAKTQGVTINWGIVGLVVVVALLIGLWQIADRPESQAADPYSSAQATNWRKMVTNLSAGVNPITGKVDVNWVEKAVSGFEIVGYRVAVLSRGAEQPEIFDLGMDQIGSNYARGLSIDPIRFATVMSKGALKATNGTITVEPMILHSVYSPYGQNQPAAGATATFMLNS